MLKIGMINYINALPYFAPFKLKSSKASYYLDCDVPALLNQKLLIGNLDCSLISSYAYLKNQDKLQLIAPFGIAGKEEVKSVLFFSKVTKPKTIYITKESLSSVKLLWLICKKYWNYSPYFQSEDDLLSKEAFLIIGDEALKCLSQKKNVFQEYECYDLAKIWFDMHQKPFPFAVLAARKNLQKNVLNEIHTLFSEHINWSNNNSDYVLDEAWKKTLLDKALLKSYFNSLTYQFTQDEYHSLTLFNEQLKEIDL